MVHIAVWLYLYIAVWIFTDIYVAERKLMHVVVWIFTDAFNILRGKKELCCKQDAEMMIPTLYSRVCSKRTQHAPVWLKLIRYVTAKGIGVKLSVCR